MKKWNTVKDIIEWANTEKRLANEWCEENFVAEIQKPNQTICSKAYRLMKIAEIDLSVINILDDELALALWDINKNDINLLNIVRFANAYEKVQFFKKSKLSVDGDKYKKGLLRLKQNADELQRLSDTEIKFRVPFLPHETIKDYIDLEFRHCLDESVLRYLVSLMDDRLRFPQKTQSSREQTKEYYENLFNTEKMIHDEFKYIDKEQGILHSHIRTDKEIKNYNQKLQKALSDVNQNYFYYTAKK